MAAHHIEDALEQLRSEFLTIPRLSLTPGEIARIVNVDPPTARTLVHVLEESHFLERTRDGRFTHVVPRSEFRTCPLCGQERVQGSGLRVEGTDEAEALWVCNDCQHKLTRGVDDEGALGG